MLNRLRSNTLQPKIAPCQIRGKVTSTYSVNPVFLKKRALRVEHFFEIGADSAQISYGHPKTFVAFTHFLLLLID